MEAGVKFSVLKVATAILFLSLVTVGGFAYQSFGKSQEEKLKLSNQKTEMVNELMQSKDSLEVAISENSSLKTDLIIERQKVTNLLREINSTNVDIAMIIKYRDEVDKLKKVIASMTKERYVLKRDNELLKIQRDSAILVLSASRRYNEQLADINETLNVSLNKGPKISVIKLRAIAFKTFKKGDMEVTDKANKVNMLKVSFDVIGSKSCKPCDKDYYVQVIDSKNNIVGERKTKKFGELILDYSYATPVKFKNESVEVVADLSIDKAEKGNYFVNVFEKSELVSKTTFALR